MNKVLAIAAAVLILGGGVWFALKDKPSDTTQKTTEPSTQTSNPNPAPPQPQTSQDEAPAANTISYNGSSFSPASLTVKAGDKVTIKNDSSKDLDFASDPHPVHSENNELNAGIVEPGKSVTITLNNKGNFGYHNHLNSSQTGSITVE